MIANNRCCECRHEWQDKPIGFARFYACPACGSAYWEWLNFADLDEGTLTTKEPSQRRPGE